MDDKEEKIVSVIVFIFLALLAILYWNIANLGKDGSDYSEVCIGGHTYYNANFLAKGMTAIKLDSNGKPVKC